MISLPVGLTLIFVIAKILGYITWSWWLVFLPVIAPFLLVVVVWAFILVIGVLAVAFGGKS